MTRSLPETFDGDNPYAVHDGKWEIGDDVRVTTKDGTLQGRICGEERPFVRVRLSNGFDYRAAPEDIDL